MKIPKVMSYFPPKTVKCANCGYKNIEAKFIKELQDKSEITPNPH
jgi:hypothetical protein